MDLLQSLVGLGEALKNELDLLVSFLAILLVCDHITLVLDYPITAKAFLAIAIAQHPALPQ